MMTAKDADTTKTRHAENSMVIKKTIINGLIVASYPKMGNESIYSWLTFVV